MLCTGPGPISTKTKNMTNTSKTIPVLHTIAPADEARQRLLGVLSAEGQYHAVKAFHHRLMADGSHALHEGLLLQLQSLRQQVIAVTDMAAQNGRQVEIRLDMAITIVE